MMLTAAWHPAGAHRLAGSPQLHPSVPPAKLRDFCTRHGAGREPCTWVTPLFSEEPDFSPEKPEMGSRAWHPPPPFQSPLALGVPGRAEPELGRCRC